MDRASQARPHDNDRLRFPANPNSDCGESFAVEGCPKISFEPESDQIEEVDQWAGAV